MRRNQVIMGTGVSIDIPDCQDQVIFEEVFQFLKDIDERFSPYKKESELSRYQRGEIAASKDLKAIQNACKKYEELTDGYFSANFSGQFDPTGYVKGWAIAGAGELIKNAGYQTFCIGIGGDILASSDGAKKWGIGIQDPSVKKYLTSQVFLYNGAVTTSGSYERGQHIINPKTGRPPAGLVSFTVAGPDIVKADVLATAGFAMGKAGIAFINRQEGYEALAIDKNGKSYLSAGMPMLLNRNQGNSRI